jgi:hypothetical protein
MVNRFWGFFSDKMLQAVEGFRFQVSAQPPAKKTTGQIEKETVPFWPSFIRGVSKQITDNREKMTDDRYCVFRFVFN